MEHKAQPWISPAGRIRHTLNRGVAAPLSDAARAGLQPAIASRAQGVSRARARRAAGIGARLCAKHLHAERTGHLRHRGPPGGAYKFVGVPGKPEADSVLEWLCATGDAAVFVLKYRVPSVGPPATPSNFGGLPWGEPALMDAQRAVRLVRWWAGHNQSLKLDPLRVGFLGLSAGAHLVAHLAWRHDERLYARLDAVDEENALPDFQILVYPWNLERLAPSSRWLGVTLLRQPSNASRPLPTFRLRARRDTPPTLLAQELTDGASPGAASAIGYFASLQAEAAGATNRTDELHLYNSTGAHGAGACRQQTSATSTARCGTRHSGTTLGSPPTSLRELHHNPCSHRMCEDWPKKALRFMRRLVSM